MTLYLDTEFNGHGGELISIALVNVMAGRIDDEFYEVVAFPDPEVQHPWVKANVLPKLNQAPVGREVTRKRLFKFLVRNPGLIYADWPADFEHLLGLLYKDQDPSRAFTIELNMCLRNTQGVQSTEPHNALADARALAAYFIALEKGPKPRKAKS